MIKEFENFIIEYDREIDYMQEIVDTLEKGTKDILDFFELDNLSSKKKVVIFSYREKYKEHILKYTPEFMEWMNADTYDGNINLLEISEARKSKAHEDMDFNEFNKCILHEFVHSCQQEINENADNVEWFWEALATNLSTQDFHSISLDDCDFELLKTNFNGTKNGYEYAYTLGKYMLDNFPKDRILNYVKNPKVLMNDADDIFNDVKNSQINM